nr:hypothetical protein [Legionella jordanis]
MIKQSKGELTRNRIKQALLRLKNNCLKIAEKDRTISISSLVKEAEVSRATIHNNYPEFAEIIRELNNKSPKAQCTEQQDEIRNLMNKNIKLQSEFQKLTQI